MRHKVFTLAINKQQINADSRNAYVGDAICFISRIIFFVLI